VAEGDPEGLRIVDRANWTGLGFVVPRERWKTARARPEFDRPGIYILSAYEQDEIGQDRLVLYIGQTEVLRSRLDQHDAGKEFWERATVFVSTNSSLNRAHVLWLEWSLLELAKAMGGCRLTNGAAGKEPVLSEWEKADTRAFLREVLRILPLVGLTAFEAPTVIKVPTVAPKPLPARAGVVIDTIIVPAQPDGFQHAFIEENAWWAIRISKSAISKLRWIAAYRVSPISAVTHIAEIDRIEPYADSGKYKVFFKGPATALAKPIPFGDAMSGAMQGPRYTSHARMMTAKTVKDFTW
jgi:hypothetical protein